MREFSIHGVIRQIIGSIKPVGSSGEDAKILINLGNHIDLVDALLHDIYTVSKAKNHHESSMKEIGEKADKYLKTLVDYNE